MEKDFNNLIKEIRKCNICEAKFGFKPHPVVIGSATSKIVQISQAPSKTVDTTLKPFSDINFNLSSLRSLRAPSPLIN